MIEIYCYSFSINYRLIRRYLNILIASNRLVDQAAVDVAINDRFGITSVSANHAKTNIVHPSRHPSTMTAQLNRTQLDRIPAIVQQQRAYFATGETKPLRFRLAQLQKLKQAVLDRQDDILAAVKADLGRPEFEGYFELASLMEINVALKQLKTWMQPQKVATSVDVFPAQAWVQPDPLGVVLIIGPWNYPFSLVFSPLVGAIAAGNCAIVKPSEQAPHTSRVVADLIRSTFDPEYVAVLEGDATVSQALLAERFDHIFFTGGGAIGTIVMTAAAQHLTPVTLELGGKSPCIVDADTNLERAAKRIIWGKFINAGQTCIAPDYLLVDRRIKAEFLPLLKQAIHNFYGENPAASNDYGRMINARHFDRLVGFLKDGETIAGGQFDAASRYIAPTILAQVSWDAPVMQEEIFGPILPVLAYEDLDQAIALINQRPKPLALYLFSNDASKQQQILDNTSSGGVCINDTVMQFGISGLPFGGVGSSGMGRYHGKYSFDTFSHFKAVLKRGMWLDLAWRYAPYTAARVKQIRGIVMR
jgi:aldehyde dehydrogenase (NAD+)